MTPSTISHPDGYELIEGRGIKNAKKAIELAESRGFDGGAVLTTKAGYLVPVAEDNIDVVDEIVADDPDGEVVEVEAELVPDASNTRDELDKFAADHGIDTAGAKNKQDVADAIAAWVQAQPEAEFTAANESEKED